MPNPQGVIQVNPANKTVGRHPYNYSTFDKSLSYRLANTLRFGDYTPSFLMDGVPDDSIDLNTADAIDSLSLKAPFKGSVRKIKESFKVPNMAILPLNWDRIYTQPSNGDDVPKDANCVLEDFPHRFSSFWDYLYGLLRTNLPGSGATNADICSFLTAVLRVVVLGEFVYSSGSLLSVCGYKGNAQFSFANGELDSYDNWVDLLMPALFSSVLTFSVNEPVGSSMVTHHFRGLSGQTLAAGTVLYGSFRAALELFRENPSCSIVSLQFDSSTTLATYISNKLAPLTAANTGLLRASGLNFNLPHSAASFDTTTDITALNPNTLNLTRILSYQLVCAHFYSNSSVDFVYSAELYRQYIYSLWRSINLPSYSSYMHFTWNGIGCPFDYLSGHLLASQLYLDLATGVSFKPVYSSVSGSSVNSFTVRLASFAAIFGFRKSLRFGDYFVASRPRPLAPINTDVSVNNNAVSVVDITRNIQAQRFANAVMRSRSKIDEYVKSIFGKAPAPDYHNPFFLAREEEYIFGDEVQNTGAAQSTQANSRTSNFASNMGRYTFSFDNDDNHPCTYLQVVSFDIKRFYTRSVERQFLHIDRYDMFLPDMQFIGDQPIYGIELGYPISTSFPDTFAYQSRDMEYKQRFDQASGGFVESLPGWVLTDRDRSREVYGHLSPDFIRSYNTEFDQFFLSLAGGYSLGSYFHFAMITTNNVNARRAMVVDPQILG